MEEATIKIELINKIEHADPKQLKEIYGLLFNYFNSQDTIGEWESLPECQKERIEKSIQQANAGLGTPARDIIKRTREKYGLNG